MGHFDFYQGDFTFICPRNWKRRPTCIRVKKIKGAEVLASAPIRSMSAKTWHEQSPAIKGVDFPMLSDSTGKVAKEFSLYY